MHQIEQPQRHRSSSLFAALITIALMIFLGQPGTAMAQWATSGNDISNTNSGNVGIGTSSPATKLEVQGPDAAVTLSSTGAQGKAVMQAISMALSLNANALY